MHLASFGQILDWFVESLQGQHATLLIIVVALIAAVALVLFIRCLLQAAPRPTITEARIRVDSQDLPSFRRFRGSLIAANSGGKQCHMTTVQVLHENLRFQISDIADQPKTDLSLRGKGTIGIQLPSSIKNGREKTIFFLGSHNVETYEALPESLSLEVCFDCRKEPLRYNLVRKYEVKAYGLYLFGATKTRETSTK